MTKRVSVLVALDGADDGLKKAIVGAERSLGEFAGAAKTAGQRASAGLAEVKAGARTFTEQIDRAKTQLLAFVGISWATNQIRQLVQVADAWSSFTARLKLATAGQQEFITAQRELFGIAQRIGVPIEETTKLYGKLQQAVRQLGGDQKEALQITETISQALAVSGASATEAQASLLQFGQALAAGVLRGEEFNSVVENSPRLAKALADGLNVPIGRLRKLAEEGQLTADTVVNALLGQKDKLAAEYAAMPQTVGQAFTRLQNAFAQWVGQVDSATGASTKLAAAITALANNIEPVMSALGTLSQVGIGVLLWRMLPALQTAWQVTMAAGTTAAAATSAAWATANQTLTAVIANVGLLKASFATMAAGVIGWEIGTWLSEKFAVVRDAGIYMVEQLIVYFEKLRYGWEVVEALFTSDTIEEATRRHEARLAEMHGIFTQMHADAQRNVDDAARVMESAGDVAAAVAIRLNAVRQGAQEATGRGVEAVDGALTKLKGALDAVEQQHGKSTQAMTEALGRLGAAYDGLRGNIEAALQEQLDALDKRYEQEKSALERSRDSQLANITQSTKILVDAIAEQAGLRKQATDATIALIDKEGEARVVAAGKQGKTEQDRLANVRKVEGEILSARMATLAQAADSYRRHIDQLNADANRHLTEVKRVEDEKRALHMSTDERIRSLAQSAMTAYEAYQDKLSQITDLQVKARAAINAGEYDKAQEYAKRAQDLASQTAGAVVEGDRAIVTQKQAVAAAIASIKASEDLAIEALNKEGDAHKAAADSAISARDKISDTLTETQGQIDKIRATLEEGFDLTITADTKQVLDAVADLEKVITERERLLTIRTDLEQAKVELQKFEALLKEGKDLPVGADVTKARKALDDLKAYAVEKANIDLRVSTDKATSSLNLIESQMKALDRIKTESQHTLNSNVDKVRAEIKSLDGGVTQSEHIINVKRVEQNATGGLVGETGARFASGGPVGAFPRMGGGVVPGVGNDDTVPRTLDAGAFVMRKAAVAKYGPGLMALLASGVRRFAGGGWATPPAWKKRDPWQEEMAERERRSTTAPIIDPKKGWQSGDSFQTNEPPVQFDTRKVAESMVNATNVLAYAREMLTWRQNSPLIGALRPEIERGIAAVERNPNDRDAIMKLLRAAETIGSNPAVFGAWGATGSLGVVEKAIWFADWLDRRGMSGGTGAMVSSAETSEFAKRFFRGAEVGQRMLGGSGFGAQFFGSAPRWPGSGSSTQPGSRLRPMATGGATGTDTVPALLTPGEYVINRSAVSRLGVGFLSALNAMRVPAVDLARRVRGYARGGLVDAATSPLHALAGAGAVGGATRTIRVELVSGRRLVAATVDGRDETALLDLLREAKARA